MNGGDDETRTRDLCRNRALPLGGLSGFNGLRVFLVAYGGFSGHGWEGFVQRFVQRVKRVAREHI